MALDVVRRQAQFARMNIPWLRAVWLSISFLLCSSAVRASDPASSPRLTVELRDGSRVVGTSVEEKLKFHSALLGDLKLDVSDLRSVECVSSNFAKLTTVGGDTLAVSFRESALAVKTSFGKVELAANSIRRCTVSATGAAGAHPAGLVALWSGEGDGVDSAGGNSAMLTDISFAEGKVGQAFAFNGSSSTIRIPAAPALDIGAGEGFTIMAWLKPSQVDGLHPLLQWSDENPLNLWIGIRPYENGVLRGDISDEARNHFVVSFPNALTAGVFQHIAFTYDKTSGMGVLYLNGVVVAHRNLGRQLRAKTSGDLWISQRDDHPGNWSTGRTYAGLMDEIAIYNRALSAAEIQGICAEENQGEPLALPTPSAGWLESWIQ